MIQNKPVVDIITPVYGGLEFLEKLTATLYKYDAGIPYHWYIIDDKTPENKGRKELIAYYEKLKSDHDNLTIITSSENGGYAKSNNIAVRKGKSPFILLLNSDIMIIHDNWLKMMVNTLTESESNGIVGPKLLFFPDSTDKNRPAGKIQHAGVFYNINGGPYHKFVGWNVNHPKVNRKLYINAVTGACLLTRRKLWNHIGGLNEEYSTGNFEDIEYCVKVRSLNYKVVYEPTASLYHYAGGSENNTTAQINLQIFMRNNKDKLVWDDWMY